MKLVDSSLYDRNDGCDCMEFAYLNNFIWSFSENGACCRWQKFVVVQLQ